MSEAVKIGDVLITVTGNKSVIARDRRRRRPSTRASRPCGNHFE
jgi:S-adenosylhomocysteine hydrolase